MPDAAIGPSTSSRTEAAPAAPIETVEDAEGVLQAARRGAVQVGWASHLRQLFCTHSISSWLAG